MEFVKRMMVIGRKVLILIIMEDTHGEFVQADSDYINPCLNPYYNGRYSWRANLLGSHTQSKVLILIIMEDTHGDDDLRFAAEALLVLILIIMEDTHGESRHISP